MKAKKIPTLLLLASLTLAACKYDDSELWEQVNQINQNTEELAAQAARLAALETWQKQTNQSIAAIQELLNTTDLITEVSAATEGGETVGYTISFRHSDPITIYNGAKGTDGQTPQIGLTQAEDGNWYWTLNGELLTDADNNPIRANGQDGATGPEGQPGADGTSAPTPQILLGSSITSGTVQTDNGQIVDDAWYLSVDGGATWYRVSGTDGADGEDGNTWFSEAPRKEGNYYIFTLATGGSFRVAAYQPFCILAEGETLESFDNAAVWVDEATTLYLSIGEEIEYSSIVAQATPLDNNAVLTRADAGGWSAKVAKDAATGSVTVTVTPSDVGCALLDVSLILRDGGKLTASRLLANGYIYDSGTNTYMVHSVDGLLAWNEVARSDLSTNCTLEADINLTGKEWTPVGTFSSYNGTFDGGNHTITGLTVNQPETNNVGLIGFLGSGGKVQNLTLERVNITGANYVGGVVGDNYYGIVTACNVSGSISGQSSVGGVAGYNYSGSVTTCDYAGSISGQSNIGGVAGSNYGIMTDCYAMGDVSGTDSSVGGVVGSNTVGGIVTACYHASGSISGQSNVGGVAGQNDSSIVTACYHASGSISGQSNVGGVVGYNSNSTVAACYWSDYTGNGIGTNEDIGETTQETTQVDGSTVTWQTAVDGMNSAIATWNEENPDRTCDWRYGLGDDGLPTLVKE
ncbi:PL29 family lyase N-terminal domain-containing protein [Alistipes megaguti]|uniref:PL29 family lyase N-terminal domain-containing protein n=1 Tax=Alistipes megaguti TaxID=2364787 RepID=UPI002352CAC3|nr:PL29 family lyase N-terminal domain-containing protein [Alistipes megaguti]